MDLFRIVEPEAQLSRIWRGVRFTGFGDIVRLLSGQMLGSNLGGERENINILNISIILIN
jgi:hypothetical protein